MIRKLAGRVVDWQTQHHLLSEKDKGLYQYAYEVLLNQIINILIAILIAVLFSAPMPVLVFLICYIPLRSYCGGHHARTNEGCMVVSGILLCTVCIMFKILPKNAGIVMQPLSYLASGFLIICFAPVEDANKPLSEEETARYRKRGRLIWLVEAFAGIALFLTKNPVGVAAALSHIVLCFMLCWGMILNKKYD